MSSLSLSSSAPVLSRRLRQRLEQLGVAIVLLDAEGRTVVMHPSPMLDRLIAQSQPFRAAVRQHWPRLSRGRAEAVEIWPGLFVQPFQVERRRRVGDFDRNGKTFAVILVTDEAVDSEQMHSVCDSSGVDYQATVDMARRKPLLRRSEAERLIPLLNWMQEDAIEVERRCAEVYSLSQQLLESYEELSLLYKFSNSMTVTQPPTTFLADTCRELQQVADLSWLVMMLAEDQPHLDVLAGRLFTAGALPCPTETLRDVAGALIRLRGDSAEPLIVDETDALHIPELAGITQSLLVVPLRREHQIIGVLFAGDKNDGSHISSVDAKLCSSIGNSASMFLENMMLYEDAQCMFIGTLHALTASIDAKDSYTHGHSERVAMMSRKLAKAYGLDDYLVERVYLSGLVHDVGKIGVPESVLMKPGPLSSDEYELIKMHPETGARILQDIPQMSDLIPGVLHHHERWDGRGYPFGLSGEDIPLFGRLIGLADAFDAMASNRAYRARREVDEVLREIRECAGSQFDPELAELFVLLDFSDYERLCRQHHENEHQPLGLQTGRAVKTSMRSPQS